MQENVRKTEQKTWKKVNKNLRTRKKKQKEKVQYFSVSRKAKTLKRYSKILIMELFLFFKEIVVKGIHKEL